MPQVVRNPGPRGRKPRTALALVIAISLLTCHGLFGASHVLGHGEVSGRTHADEPAAAADALPVHHGSGRADAGGPGVPAGPSSPAGSAEYFAVLLALVGAALLAALSGFLRALPLTPARRVLLPLRALPFGSLPRGPSPPLLQVFRL